MTNVLVCAEKLSCRKVTLATNIVTRVEKISCRKEMLATTCAFIDGVDSTSIRVGSKSFQDMKMFAFTSKLNVHYIFRFKQ